MEVVPRQVEDGRPAGEHPVVFELFASSLAEAKAEVIKSEDPAGSGRVDRAKVRGYDKREAGVLPDDQGLMTSKVCKCGEIYVRFMPNYDCYYYLLEN